MAPGLKVGDRVKAKPTVIFGCRRAGDIFGPWASEREVHGTVKDVLGNGWSRKLQVIWDECSDISTVSPRVLQLDNSCAMLQEDNESVSSQSGEEEEVVSPVIWRNERSRKLRFVNFWISFRGTFHKECMAFLQT